MHMQTLLLPILLSLTTASPAHTKASTSTSTSIPTTSTSAYRTSPPSAPSPPSLRFSGPPPLHFLPALTTPPAYVTAFPVCGTPGFTAEPGDHYNDVYPPAPVSQPDCVRACRRNASCKAVSYAAEYRLCSFYRLYMMQDQLEEDASSNFKHFDDFCGV
ncbi:hypothetical protein MMC34_007532 [Xylographa carneopallida]|nr:hypothetical protein [Xylographa carneopallida]